MAFFAPLIARTTRHRRQMAVAVYGCVRFIVIRSGSAILSGDFGQ